MKSDDPITKLRNNPILNELDLDYVEPVQLNPNGESVNNLWSIIDNLVYIYIYI